MKTLLASILSVVLINVLSISATAQTKQQQPQGEPGWVQVPSGTTRPVGTPTVQDVNTLWAGTLDGVLRSTDQGLSWSFVSNVPKGLPTFADEQRGYMFSNGVYRTDDGGVTWDSLNVTQLQVLDCFTRIGRDTLFASGNGDVSRSVDGGRTWFNRELPSSEFRDIAFRDSKYGIAVGPAQAVIFDSGATGAFIVTTNGGESWQQRYSGLHHDIDAVAFPDKNTIVVASTSGYISRSTDGGYHWKDSLYTEKGWGFSDLSFIPGGRGLAVGGRPGYIARIMTSSDFGVSWTPMETPSTAADLHAVAYINDTLAIATGDKGTILRMTGTGTVGVKRVEPRSFSLEVYPDPARDYVRLRYSLPLRSTLTVRIANTTGKVFPVAQPKGAVEAGQQEYEINTRKWPSGKYIVTIAAGEITGMGTFTIIR